jgi:hypothetical protein
MRSDGSTARDRSTPPTPRGTGESGLGRLLALSAPSLATVGGLLALALVAPKTGSFVLLVVTTTGGLLLAKVDRDPTGSLADNGVGEGTDPRAFLRRYFLGLAVFGGIGLALTLLFLL